MMEVRTKFRESGVEEPRVNFYPLTAASCSLNLETLVLSCLLSLMMQHWPSWVEAAEGSVSWIQASSSSESLQICCNLSRSMSFFFLVASGSFRASKRVTKDSCLARMFPESGWPISSKCAAMSVRVSTWFWWRKQCVLGNYIIC